MEILEIVLIKRIPNDLNVQLIQILMAQASLEVRCKRCFDQDTVVEFFDIGRYAEDRHGFEPAERVAALEELAGISFVKCACDEESDVVDHVAVGKIVHELCERADCIGSYIAEF